jgi:phage host-nuclease inhibitor protein Gam
MSPKEPLTPEAQALEAERLHDAIESIGGYDYPPDAEVPDLILEIEADMAEFMDAAGLTDDAAAWELARREIYIDGVLKRLRDLEDQRARDLEVYEAQRAVVDLWHDTQQYRAEASRAYLESLIGDVVTRDADEFKLTYGSGKKKSRNLPHGTIGFRASKATVNITDQEKAVAWAEANEVEVKVRKELLKTPAIEFVTAALSTTGELPDEEEHGLEYVEPVQKFFIKPKPPKAKEAEDQ